MFDLFGEQNKKGGMANAGTDRRRAGVGRYREAARGLKDKICKKLRGRPKMGQDRRAPMGEDGDAPIVVSMGMFIIDEIHFGDGRESVNDIIGGAGTYTVLGARVFLKGRDSRRAAFIVDVGSDFPQPVMDQLNQYNFGTVFRTDKSRLTTRGWNMYGDNENRKFDYLTPKLRIEAEDITSDAFLSRSLSVHAICSPTRLIDIANGVDKTIIWEPVPTECNAENWDPCKQALKRVEVFSPNAAEAAAFFGRPEPSSKEAIVSLATEFLSHMNQPHAVVAIRCGAMGSYIQSAAYSHWFPAYHTDSSKVKDPTGGGNCYLGGFAAGYILSGRRLDVAGIYASVAASTAIEQIGLPELTMDGSRELFNGIETDDRIKQYCQANGLDVPEGILH
uniref:ARAD1A18172p n=1 Tax=Blastobotrys adeninivorans TaxID=409370 RepID=A0A060T3R4_BLAAD